MADTFPVKAQSDAQDNVFQSDLLLQRKKQAESQLGTLGNIKTAIEGSAAADIVTKLTNDGQRAVDLKREAQLVANQRADAAGRPHVPPQHQDVVTAYENKKAAFDKKAAANDLLKDIPTQYHADIMAEPTLEAAVMARKVVTDNMQREELINMQFDGALTRFSASMLDIDLFLNLSTGGMIGAAKVAGLAAKLNKSERFVGAVQLGVGGGQAGALVTGTSAALDPTVGVEDIVAGTIASAFLGAGIGTVTGPASHASVNDAISALEQDYVNKVATADPSLDVPLVRDNEQIDSAFTQTVVDGSVGAAATGTSSKVPKRKLKDPLGTIPEGQQALIDDAHAKNHDSGFYDRKKADEGDLATKIAKHPWNSVVGQGFAARLYSSESAILNRMGYTLFESGSGMNRGQATAAGLEELYRRQLGTDLLPVSSNMYAWAQKNNRGALGTKYGISEAGKHEFNRELLLERNAREHGRRYSTDEHINAAADAYDNMVERAHKIMVGRDGQPSVKGMEGVKPNRHYTPYSWVPDAIVRAIRKGITTRKDIVQGLAQGYRNSGMAVGKDALAVAEAVIRRAESNEAGIDTNVLGLLQGDGQEWLRSALEQQGMEPMAIDGLMTRMVGRQAERSQEGFTKSKNTIDMETPIKTSDGSTLQIVDFLSTDLRGTFEHYSRGVAGSSALARHGITSRAARKELIDAARTEQRALGETPIDAKELEAQFSEFDAGPTKGWSAALGGSGDPAAPGAAVANVKRTVSLAWMNQVGLTQLGETGAAIAAFGLEGWAKAGPMEWINKELAKRNKRVLDDLSYIVGDIGSDERIFPDHLGMDEMSAIDQGTWMSKFNTFTSNASFAQGFISLFNIVRAKQQKIAALGVTNKLFMDIRRAMDAGVELSDKEKGRIWTDLGVDQEMITEIERMINAGLIEFDPKDGYVNRLYGEKWDADFREKFGVAIIRNINNIVQKAMIGERDAWMSTVWGSLMTQFKTFPMQATHKQVLRLARHNDMRAFGAVAFGLATAFGASMVKDALNMQSHDMSYHAKRALGYSNMTGFIPMTYDPLMTMLGLNDMRLNQYGRETDAVSVPAIEWVNGITKVVGATAKGIAGTADGNDVRALRAIPYGNTLLIGAMLSNIARRNN